MAGDIEEPAPFLYQSPTVTVKMGLVQADVEATHDSHVL